MRAEFNIFMLLSSVQGEKVLSKFSFIYIRESEQNMGILFQRYVYSIFAILYKISYAIGDYIFCWSPAYKFDA